MNETKLIMESWRGYVKVCEEEDKITAEKLRDPDYLREVLDIQIPLNESYPYSPKLTAELLREVTLAEGSIRDWASRTWATIKAIPGEIGDFLKSLWSVMRGGKLLLYWRGLKRAGLELLQENLNKVFDMVIKVRGKFPGSEKFADWAQTAKEKLAAAAESLMGATGIGAKRDDSLSEQAPTLTRRAPPSIPKILGATVFLVGMQLMWNEIKDWAGGLLLAGTAVGDKMEILKKAAIEVTKTALIKIIAYLAGIAGVALATKGGALIAGVLLELGKWAAKGVSAVLAVLRPALKFYKGRGGLNESEGLKQ